MSDERLHFEPGGTGYQWMTASEHVARYAFAAPLCRGRRVLDVACGEGYGSLLLARAGAHSVVGVDVAAEAIAVAEARFAAPNVRYIVGDALDLSTVLAEEKPFDVVVSYETLEHVPDAGRLLEGIRAVLAPDGIVVISAPNEPDPLERGSVNPFHRLALTFEQFHDLTESHLGAASGWYLGTPLQGMVLVAAETPLLLNDRSDPALMLEAEGGVPTWLLPAQRELQVGETNCAFFVGVWGSDANGVVAASPASLSGVLEPWKALEWFKSENSRLLRDTGGSGAGPQESTTDARSRMLSEVIADLRRAALLDRSRLEAADATVAELRAAVDAAEAGRYADAENRRRFDEEQRLAAQAERERLESELEALTARLQVIDMSRGWRLVQGYVRLVDRPVVGLPFRAARRLLGWR